MGYYLVQGSYASASVKSLINNPSDREQAARKAIESIGGTLHHWFLAFGEHDFVLICEFPDDIVAAATSMVVSSTGGFSSYKSTKLMTAPEAIKAMTLAKEKAGSYSAPG